MLVRDIEYSPYSSPTLLPSIKLLGRHSIASSVSLYAILMLLSLNAAVAVSQCLEVGGKLEFL